MSFSVLFTDREGCKQKAADLQQVKGLNKTCNPVSFGVHRMKENMNFLVILLGLCFHQAAGGELLNSLSFFMTYPTFNVF